jgi:hypothetical protein
MGYTAHGGIESGCKIFEAAQERRFLIDRPSPLLLTEIETSKAIPVAGRGGLRGYEVSIFSRQSAHRWR